LSYIPNTSTTVTHRREAATGRGDACHCRLAQEDAGMEAADAVRHVTLGDRIWTGVTSLRRHPVA